MSGNKKTNGRYAVSEDTARVKGKMSEYTQKKNRHTFTRLLSYFFLHPWLTVSAVLLAILSNVALVSKTYILKLIIDGNLKAGANDFSSIIFWGIIYFVTVLVCMVSDYSQSLCLSSLGQRIMHKLRTELFAHIQKLNMRFFDKNSSGSVLTRVNSDIESLSDFYSNLVVNFAKDIILIIIIMCTMLQLDPQLALVCFLSIPIVAVISLIYRHFARNNFIRLKAQLSRINSFLAENIIGMKIVQIFAREKEKKAEFTEMNNRYFRFGRVEVMLNSLSQPLLNALANLVVALLISLFASRVMAGALQIGVLYAFVTYITQLFDPISAIAEQFTAVQSAIISADRVFDITDNTEDLEDTKAGLTPEDFKGDIVFDHVWFAYNEEDYVLKDVSFHIKPGQRIAFVGATGSGKTTIISLLARFYTIQKGRITIDGIDIGEYCLSYLRRKIAVVMQDVFLFSGDINYNIRLNEEDISDDDIKTAAESVNADSFIGRLPDGYTHHVAERGGEFSAGQRQLIAFARAVAFDPAVLVLDEATSNIDVETEIAIQGALDNIAKERTSIVIAHRLSTIVSSDCIFVLHKGVLRESGTHTELLEQNGIYARLYSILVKSNEATLLGHSKS